MGAFTADLMWMRRVGHEWVFKRGIDLDELFAVDNPDNLYGA